MHQAGLRPPWLQSEHSFDYKRFGYIKGLSGDQIAYASQASEAVYVSLQGGAEVKLEILMDNYLHIEERLYTAVHRDNYHSLQSCLHLTNAPCEVMVAVRFDLKHSYFNQLHKSLQHLSEEVISRLFPEPSNFTLPPRRPIEQTLILREMGIPQDKIQALEAIVSCPSDGPPVLVSGAFGTGKTRLLALAAHHFFQESRRTGHSARILVCTQQQKSADAFLECFVFELLLPLDNSIKISRLMRESAQKNPVLKRWCKPAKSFQMEKRSHYQQSNHLVITTCMSSLQLATSCRHFFTHIFLDEGAQTREPEGVAPLSLAMRHTKIVIAGDSHQVWRALLPPPPSLPIPIPLPLPLPPCLPPTSLSLSLSFSFPLPLPLSHAH